MNSAFRGESPSPYSEHEKTTIERASFESVRSTSSTGAGANGTQRGTPSGSGKPRRSHKQRKRRRTKAKKQSLQIIVGNFSSEIDPVLLVEHFSDHCGTAKAFDFGYAVGPINFGFITFHDVEAVEKAKLLNNTCIYGETVTVTVQNRSKSNTSAVEINKKLIVKELPYSFDNIEDIHNEIFAMTGLNPVKVEVYRDWRKLSRGVAGVTFVDTKAAMEAKKRLTGDSVLMKGRRISVEYYTAKNEKKKPPGTPVSIGSDGARSHSGSIDSTTSTVVLSKTSVTPEHFKDSKGVEGSRTNASVDDGSRMLTKGISLVSSSLGDIGVHDLHNTTHEEVSELLGLLDNDDIDRTHNMSSTSSIDADSSNGEYHSAGDRSRSLSFGQESSVSSGAGSPIFWSSYGGGSITGLQALSLGSPRGLSGTAQGVPKSAPTVGEKNGACQLQNRSPPPNAFKIMNSMRAYGTRGEGNSPPAVPWRRRSGIVKHSGSDSGFQASSSKTGGSMLYAKGPDGSRGFTLKRSRS